MTDDELKALVASLSVAHKEMLASNAASKRELDLQLEKTDAQIAKRQAKTDAQIAETEAQLKKTSQKLDRLSDLVGNISNNQGDIAEEFFYTSFAKNPSLGDIHFDSLNRNIIGRIGNLQEEYDLLLLNNHRLKPVGFLLRTESPDTRRLDDAFRVQP